jgi:RNA recognition motif-containing protein
LLKNNIYTMSTTKMEVKSRKGESTKKRKAGESVDEPTETIAPKLNSLLPHSPEPRYVSKAEPAMFSPQTPELDDSLEGPSPKKRKLSVEEIEVDITAPEPPSKKALRRLKKGKPLPAPKSGADSSPEPESESENPKNAEAEKRSAHGIWIGNLPWSVTKADLRTFFTSNSDIADETITRIHMPSPDDGKPANKVKEVKPWKKQHNKGFAYVDFDVPEAVSQAVALSEQLLGGRRVLVKNNKSFEGRPQKTKEESRRDSKAPSRRVFLGNLRFDTNEESLKEHFEKCGAVENVMVATFEDSGKCKGYAWITFEELEAAESAVRGYVLVEEQEVDPDSEADSSEVSASEGEEEAKGSKRTNTKKPAMKKWWVDKIHKRPVRREFAEDAQVRYKKRFGKDAIKGKSDANIGVEENFDRDERVEKVVPHKQVEYRTPYAARLTGGIVESKGKKVVF